METTKLYLPILHLTHIVTFEIFPCFILVSTFSRKNWQIRGIQYLHDPSMSIIYACIKPKFPVKII